MTLSALFELLASTTWSTIDRAARNRIQYGEDAITSVNLNALASFLSPRLVIDDTRVDESTKGCDFEFWVGRTGLGWARYAIQAKKINRSTSSYTKLAHKAGSEYQIDVLERYSKANRAASLYCFYNYSSDSHDWNCSLPVDSSQLGCSVTPSAVVRDHMQRRGARSFAAIHSNPATLPWRCLVRCPRVHLLPALAHTGWPDPSSFLHEKLPPSLDRLRKETVGSGLVDAPDVFRREVGLRPRWIALLDLTEQGEELG